MILKKILGVVLVLVGLVLAAGAYYVTFTSLDAEPVLLSEPVEASGRVTELMDAIVACDYDKASGVLYGTPQLGLDRDPADEVGVMLWDAFTDSQSYELKGNCEAQDSGLTQQVVIPALMPPRMSEVRLSPTIMVFLGSKSGIWAKHLSKYSRAGLL